MPIEPDTKDRPNADWPTVDGPTEDGSIETNRSGPFERFRVIGYADTDDGDPCAVLQQGGGRPGLYRMLRDGDDAVIEYHKPMGGVPGYRGARTRREWHPLFRLSGWFDD